MKTSYECLSAIEELLDNALSELSTEAFAVVLDGLDMMLCDYEEQNGATVVDRE